MPPPSTEITDITYENLIERKTSIKIRNIKDDLIVECSLLDMWQLFMKL